MAENAIRSIGKSWAPSARLRRFLAHAATFSFVAFAWIFFRAPSLRTALYIVRHLTTGLVGDVVTILRQGHAGAVSWGMLASSSALIGSMTLLEAADRRKPLFERTRKWAPTLRYGFYFALVYSSIFFGQSDVQFIYFQF